MIVEKDINPERDLYYLGAKVIEVIASTGNSTIDFFAVFEKLNASKTISINLFIYTLDWLYLIGVINKSNNGNIIKCF